MDVLITPRLLHGAVTPPPSKSQAHRLLIAAALADGVSTISGVDPSEDILSTIRCLEALGAEISRQDSFVTIRGISGPSQMPEMDCGESGSTLRFLIPAALCTAGRGRFLGHGRLMQRPQEPYFALFREKQIAYSRQDGALTVEGTLLPGIYRLQGDVSSQFITGLLFALPLLSEDSDIVLTTELESAGYVDMTLHALAQFGVSAQKTASGWHIPGCQRYCPQDVSVEADYSQAALFYAAADIGNPLRVCGMNPNSRQGDRIFLDYAQLLNGPGTVRLDVRDCPDLVPALAVRAALRNGRITEILHAGRLRLKESDRLASVTQVLGALGADIEEAQDSLTIRGKSALTGGSVNSWNDHRIAMMAAIAATRCCVPVTVSGAECVRKSYPAFWDDYRSLGGIVEEIA